MFGLSAAMIAAGLASSLYSELISGPDEQWFRNLGSIAFFIGLAVLALVHMTGSDWWRSRDMTDPVRGKAVVVDVSPVNPEGDYQTYGMMCVVSAPGLAATPVPHQGWVMSAKFPSPGDALPVTVDRADPTRLKVLWDEVPTIAERAFAAATRVAGCREP